MKKGHITISRPSSGLKSWVNIDIEDEHYKMIINVDIMLDKFAQAVTGLGSIDMEYETFPKD